MKKILLFVALFISYISYSQSSEGTLAMYVESGGKGIKFGLLRFMDIKRIKYQIVDSRELNVGLSAGISRNKRIALSDINSGIQSMSDIYYQLLDKYLPLGLRKENIFFYTSSGLGQAENINEYCDSVKSKMNFNVKIIRDIDEAKYTIAGTIPYEKIDNAFTIDQGGSNTKGGYVSKLKDMLVANTVVFDLGSVRLHEVVKKYMNTKGLDDETKEDQEYIRALDYCFDSIKVQIKNEFEKIEDLDGKNELYLSGGAAFCITTLINPEYDKKSQLVPINLSDLKSFLIKIKSDRQFYEELKSKSYQDLEY